ncbi:MAG TPA: aldehyde dehydrogenase family protein, partial [Lacipirellulaceae bacterium]|nr:aldehyde dehydrogenase family protein [Lacipirellulaceae bacterium]
DRDLAIKNVLHSAFSHSGQKCSATSLLILEDEVYHDRRFRDTLCDAVESLRVGSVWDLATKMGPLIHPPAGPMERALKELEPGESWAVMPRLHIDGNPCLVSPGVKWGVSPGSFTHSTELFGPVLGVMRAADLGEAIDLVHATGYGLTSGLESLDDREQCQWQKSLQAGNLYINRSTTGAVVERQPFGGMRKSAFGPGVKAGGPNYVAPLMRFTDATDDPQAPGAHASGAHPTGAPPGSPGDAHRHGAGEHLAALRAALARPAERPPLTAEDRCRLVGAIDSYAHWASQEFGAEHDPQQLLGEDNIRRYQAVDPLWIRITDEDAAFDVFARACAARAAGSRIVVSSPPELAAAPRDAVALLDALTDSWAAAIEFVVESDAELAAALSAGRVGRIRYAGPHRAAEAIRRAAADAFVHLADAPPLAHGRIELLWYIQEQSVARVYHRYGNLGRRAAEPRTTPISP